MKWLKQAITDYDNKTVDTGRLIGVYLIFALSVFQGYAVWRSGTFDPMSFGTGCAAVLAALGLAIAGDNAKRP